MRPQAGQLPSMPTFLSGPALSTAIQTTVSEGPCDLAVAFWGAGAADLLGLPQEARGYRIACDAFSGACNPSAIKASGEARPSSTCQASNAKVYIGQASIVVGSANASANGLGEEDRETIPVLKHDYVRHGEDVGLPWDRAVAIGALKAVEPFVRAADEFRRYIPTSRPIRP